MNKETKLRIHNITAKAALKFGSEVWELKKREEQRLEAAQMKFMRHLLGITKLDKEIFCICCTLMCICCTMCVLIFLL